MSDPKRELIAQDLLSALRSIRKTAGFYTDAGLYVSRRRVPIATWNADHRAELFLFSGRSSPKPGCLGGVRDSVAEYVVIGYVSDQEPDRMVNLLEADVNVAVLMDPSRGNLAQAPFTEPADTDTDYWELVNEQQGVIAVPFRVTYRWTVASP